jgi:hypothetical protein
MHGGIRRRTIFGRGRIALLQMQFTTHQHVAVTGHAYPLDAALRVLYLHLGLTGTAHKMPLFGNKIAIINQTAGP